MSEIFTTPKEAIDAIMANPLLGDLPPGADGVEPRDTPISPDAPKMERGEDRYMSRPEAIYILGKLATSRRINVDGVIALQMGARSLMKRHFDRQRNWAKRRAARLAEDGSPHPVPEVPEVSEVPANPEEEAAQ